MGLGQRSDPSLPLLADSVGLLFFSSRLVFLCVGTCQTQDHDQNERHDREHNEADDGMYGNETIVVGGEPGHWRYAVPLELRLTDAQIEDEVARFLRDAITSPSAQ